MIEKNSEGSTIFPDYFSKEVMDVISPKYPRWEKRTFGERIEYCDCDYCEGHRVLDDDAVTIDVFVFGEKLLCDLLPKVKFKPVGWIGDIK